MNMNIVLDTLAKNLSKQKGLQAVSIYFDESELSPNSISFPCIQFQPLAWRMNYSNGCEYERELQIRIIVNTRTKRSAIVELYNYEEIVRKAVTEIMKEENGFELDLIGGTQIAILQYLNKDPDSYKTQKTLYGSAIAIRYLLRYDTDEI